MPFILGGDAYPYVGYGRVGLRTSMLCGNLGCPVNKKPYPISLYIFSARAIQSRGGAALGASAVGNVQVQTCLALPCCAG